MPTITISPYARIGALVGVLLTVLAGAAIYLMHGHSQQATVTTPSTHHPGRTHVVAPVVNPLIPAPLHGALERSPIVVAAFYNPNYSVAALTIAEARAGAATTHVGFVSLNVLDDSVAGPLTSLLPAGELLPNPGFLIYQRPGTVVFRSDGYLNRMAVAQAVKDSR